MRRILLPIVFLLVSLSIVPVMASRDQHVGVLHRFVSLQAGLNAEGLVIHDGHFYLSTFSFTASDGTIFIYDHDGTLEKSITVAGLPDVGQLAFSDNHLYVVAGNLATGKGAVLQVNPESGTVTTLATGFQLPNGLAVDQRGNLFVTDLLAGTVSKVTEHGTVSVFASGPLLAPDLVPQVGLKLGPNDLAFDSKGTGLYVTNLGKGTVVKIEIQRDGTAGAITDFAAVPTPDGAAFDVKGNLYVTSPFSNAVFLVSSNGSTQQVSFDTSHETFSNPTNLAFVGHELYVTSGAFSLPGPAHISLVNVRFPGLPLENG